MKPFLLWIIVGILPLILILGTAKQVIFDRSFYAAGFVKNSNDVPDRDQVLDDLLTYLDHHKTNLESGFNEREKAHMKDVRTTMDVLWVVYFGLTAMTVLILLGAVISIKKFDAFFSRYLLFGGLVAIGVISILFMLSLLSWNFLFTSFHKVFFPAGTWLFSERDLLIRMFPEEFFIDIAKRIFTLSFIEGFFLMFFGLLVKR